MKKLLYIFAALLVSLPALAQRNVHSIKGKVTEATGTPVVGAYVYNTVTSKGDVTSLDGSFEIQAIAGQTIKVTCMGYKEVEIPAPASALLNVTLEEDNEMLEETVVVGYGTQKKINLTGAVSVVTDEALKDRPTSNGLRALQGVDP